MDADTQTLVIKRFDVATLDKVRRLAREAGLLGEKSEAVRWAVAQFVAERERSEPDSRKPVTEGQEDAT